MFNLFQGNIKRIVEAVKFLDSQESSAGLIDNLTDEVIYRNAASLVLMKQWKLESPNFDTPENTEHLHNNLSLKHLKGKIRELPYCTDLSASASFTINYTLNFPGRGLRAVVDEFRRFDFGGRTYRAWIVLDSAPMTKE